MIAFRYLGAIFFISSISRFLRPKILTGHALPVYSTYFKISFQLNWVRNFARFSAQFERVGFRGKGKNAKREWPMGIRISACSQATVSASQNASTPFAKAPLLPFWIPFWSFHSLPAIFKLPDSRILNQQRVFLRDDALESNFESIVILDRYVLNCSNINDLKKWL